MGNYVLFSAINIGKTKPHFRVAKITDFTLDIDEARERVELARGMEDEFLFKGEMLKRKAPFEILKLPDDEHERRGLLELTTRRNIRLESCKYSQKAYLILASMGGEESDAYYIKGWYDTSASAKPFSHGLRLLSIIYKTSRLTLSGARPLGHMRDIWHHKTIQRI